jgi:hypothetical protein
MWCGVVTMDDKAIADAARRWYAAEQDLRRWQDAAMERWKRLDWSEDDDSQHRITAGARAALWLLLEEDAGISRR